MAEKVSDFMNANKLKFNAKKTHYFIYSNKQRRNNRQISLKMEGETVKISKSERLLGVQFSDNPDCKIHVDTHENSVIKTLKHRLRSIRRVASRGNYKQRKAITQGLFMSKLNYCLPVWGNNITQDLVKQIQVLQNEAVRFIMRKRRTDRLKPLYKQLNWLQFQNQLKYFEQLQLYTIRTEKTPTNLYNQVSNNYDNHGHFTRQTVNNFIRLTSNNTGNKDFITRSVHDFNNLPDNVKNSTTKNMFKQRLKEHLMSQNV